MVGLRDFLVSSLACVVRTGSIDLVEAHAASLLHARADAAQNAPLSNLCHLVCPKSVEIGLVKQSFCTHEVKHERSVLAPERLECV